MRPEFMTSMLKELFFRAAITLAIVGLIVIAVCSEPLDTSLIMEPVPATTPVERAPGPQGGASDTSPEQLLQRPPEK